MPEPIFEIESENVNCILPAHPRHRTIREIQEIQDKIILEKLEEAKEQSFKIDRKKDLYNFRALDLYCEIISKQKRAQGIVRFFLQKK